MKKLRYYLAIVLAGASLAACDDGATNGAPSGTIDESQKNYPIISLAVGNKWIYTLKEVDDEGKQVSSTQFITYETVKDTLINGITTSVYRAGGQSELFVQNSEGLFKWAKDSVGTLNLQLLYKYPLVSGEKYPLDDGAIITILWPKQKITLSFAEYDCIEILKSYKESNNAVIETQYYAKDIGLIRSEKMVVDGTTGAVRNFVQELSSINF